MMKISTNAAWILAMALTLAPAALAQDGTLTAEDESSAAGLADGSANSTTSNSAPSSDDRLSGMIFSEGLSDADPRLSRTYMGYVAQQMDNGAVDTPPNRNMDIRFKAMDRVLGGIENDVQALPDGDSGGRQQLETAMRFFNNDLRATDHGRLGNLWFSHGYGNPAYNELGQLAGSGVASPDVYRDYQGRIRGIELGSGYRNVPADEQYQAFLGQLNNYDRLGQYDNAAGSGFVGRLGHALWSPAQWWSYGSGQTPEARANLDNSFYNYAERAYPGYTRPAPRNYANPPSDDSGGASWWPEGLTPRGFGLMAGAGGF